MRLLKLLLLAVLAVLAATVGFVAVAAVAIGFLAYFSGRLALRRLSKARQPSLPSTGPRRSVRDSDVIEISATEVPARKLTK